MHIVPYRPAEQSLSGSFKMVSYGFRGLMAPVFTAFSEDGQTVVYDKIDEYGKYLKNNNVRGVLVNGTSGEGMCLTTEERCRTAESWRSTCTKYGLNLMLQIGGASVSDVCKMAAHAEAIKVDAILCLPELYFKPKNEEALVRYFLNIAKHCPNTPLLYYHIPSFTGVNINLPRFLDLAEATVSTFVGLKYTSGDMDIGQACLKPGRSVFLGADTLLSAAIALGFDSSIVTTLNICPEHSVRMFQLLEVSQLKSAQDEQVLLTRRVGDILQGGDWVGRMKAEFNRVHPHLNAGPCRRPN